MVFGIDNARDLASRRFLGPLLLVIVALVAAGLCVLGGLYFFFPPGGGSFKMAELACVSGMIDQIAA